VYVIAEAGVNHNGDIELAKELVRKAKDCGADCVKFQTFKAERIVLRDAPKAPYQLDNTNPSEPQIEMLRKLELATEHYPALMEICIKEDIEFLSTPYSVEDVEFLDKLGVRAFKIASGQIIEPAFLRHVALKGKPIILSTGMASFQEVHEAVEVIRSTGNDQLILLQCTTNYPCRPEDVNLRAMQTIEVSLKTIIGYSDHTQSEAASIAAVAMGACVIEKHFTLDKSMPGPDQLSSADPDDFRRLVKLLREAQTALGSEVKRPVEVELKNAVAMRRSIVSARFIPSGSVITEGMLSYKRPGTGIPPKQADRIIGRKALRDIPPDTLLSFEFLSD